MSEPTTRPERPIGRLVEMQAWCERRVDAMDPDADPDWWQSLSARAYIRIDRILNGRAEAAWADLTEEPTR